MRLQKYLAHSGICSRRKAEEHISNGLVQVNNVVIKALGTKIDPLKDKVLFKGQPVILKGEASKIYIALNKPVGVVSSCSHKNAKVVIDLVNIKDRIYPIGRLDKDSKGLLLLTNDGELHNKLSHPSFNHEKEYIVTTIEPVSDTALDDMANGMVIEKQKTRKAVVKRLSVSSFRITLKQGRNRQIRKMVAKTGTRVDMLKPVRIANINLGSLKEGQWRYLSPKEVKLLSQ